MYGFVFQGGLHLFKDGTVEWAPQCWYAGSNPWWYPGPYNVGMGDWYCWFSRMVVDAANYKVQYKCYIYQSAQTFSNDSPVIYTVNQDTTGMTVNNFLVGKETVSGTVYKYYQTGVEGNNGITTTAWKTLDYRMSYYDSTYGWMYCPGKVCHRNYSAITRIGSTPRGISDSNYNGVNKETSSADLVKWKYTGTTISNDATLWSGSGTPNMSVTTPFS